MDALEILKNDHDRVRDLFDQLRQERGRQQKILLFENAERDILEHSYVEEAVFYPVFKSFAELREMISDSYREHQDMRRLMKEIHELPDDSASLDGMLEKLMASVEKHIEEEERDFFAYVRQVMRRPEREQLGRHLQAAKIEHQRAAA